MSGPLRGLKVVDAAGYVTGPYAATMLGDLGADVVKVENPPKGDPMRGFGTRRRGTSVWFANFNRNKESVLLDLKNDEGKRLFLELVAGADVVILNWRSRVAGSLGLDDAVLAAINTRLVRLWITGYGPDGPLGNRPAFDTLLQAQSGLVHRQGDLLRTIVADKNTALMGVQAVLAALVRRGVTGEGDRIDMAMIDAMAYWNFPDMMEARTFTDDDDTVVASGRQGRTGVLRTADGAIVVAPVSGAQIGRCLEAVGHPEWKADLKAITDPRELSDTMLNRIEPITESGSTDHWLARFAEYDVPAAPVLDPDGHLADEQVVHNQVYSVVDHPHLGPMRRPRYPARFAAAALDDPSVTPMVGEHTDVVLERLGYGAGDVDKLRAAGAFGPVGAGAGTAY